MPYSPDNDDFPVSTTVRRAGLSIPGIPPLETPTESTVKTLQQQLQKKGIQIPPEGYVPPSTDTLLQRQLAKMEKK